MPVDKFLGVSDLDTSGATKLSGVDIAIPTDSEFAREEQKQRAMMGTTLASVLDPSTLGEGQRRLRHRQTEEARKMARIGITPVTVVNLMPFKLSLSSAIHQRYDITVAPAPFSHDKSAKDYTFRTIRHLAWDSADQGAGMDEVDNYQPIPWTPIELAEDFTREYNDIQQCGGVFWYEGDMVPDSTPGLRKKLQDARDGRNAWALKKVEAANLEYAVPNGTGKMNITEVDRSAARILIQANIIKPEQAPFLLDVGTATDGKAPETCVGCNRPKGGGALCTNCGNIFRPLEAYRESLIDYGHASFDKMTEKEWVEANTIKSQRDKLRRLQVKVKSKDEKEE